MWNTLRYLIRSQRRSLTSRTYHSCNLLPCAPKPSSHPILQPNHRNKWTPSLFFSFSSSSSSSSTVDSGSTSESAKNEPKESNNSNSESPTSFYSLSALDIDKNEIKFDQFKGKVVMVMNVASKCGATDWSYTEAKELHDKYRDKGFEVLAFPSNQFRNQEPGSNEDIKKFVREKYKADFILFDKVDVNGENTHPVYKFLKDQRNLSLFLIPIKDISWNFEKFLIDRKGRVVGRYGTAKRPLAMEQDIVKLLDEEQE